MKYFTKYLPVEGEIKEGDRFLSAWRKEHKFFWYPRADSITDTHYIWEGTPYLKSDVLSRVKLFLCSRDIQVGDDFTQKGIDISMPTVRMTCTMVDKEWVQDDEEHHYVPATVYKIIGEISPEVTWVTEGSKFEEGDIEIMYGLEFTIKGGRGRATPPEIFTFKGKPTDDDAEDRASLWSREFGNWDSIRIDWDVEKSFISHVKIKCSQCKHFH